MNMKRKFMKVLMNNKELMFPLDTNSAVTLINKLEKNWQINSTKDIKIADSITRNKFKFVSECYTSVTFMGKTFNGSL